MPVFSNDHALPRRFMRNEHLVFRQFAEANHRRRLQRQLADASRPLHGDQAVGAVVLDRRFRAGIDR